jgi:hypothetical protein
MNAGEGLHIDPASMTGAGEGLAKVTGDLDAAIAKLRSDLAAQGAPWGDDEVGQRFSGSYLETVQRAFSAIGTYRDQLEYAATQLPADGERFSTTEQANTGEFENLWPVLGDQ